MGLIRSGEMSEHEVFGEKNVPYLFGRPFA
jgi:hypothetical protein